jgi:hypothetical protein
MLVAAKADLEGKDCVSFDDAMEIAERHGFGPRVHRGGDKRGRPRGVRSNGCCDGQSPTLTLICDTKGNVFGGFTRSKWQSPIIPPPVPDSSWQGFLFRVKNPYNLDPRVFQLWSKSGASAITLSSRFGPLFGKDNLVISDRCDLMNSSRIPRPLLFTGSQTFKVSESLILGPNE